MIPQISQAPGVVQLVLNFLQALEQQGFTGDTATNYADRLTMATDNSIYQLLPDAVVFPVQRPTSRLSPGWPHRSALPRWSLRRAAAAPGLMVRR